MKKLTIRDIARLAGVSHTTVSRALNNDPLVAPKTLKKILAVVKAQRYRPDPLARRLARGRSHLIGLIVSDIKNPFYAEMARGIEDYARKRGYLVVICSADDQSDALEQYVESVIDAGIEGLIFASAKLEEPVVEKLIDDRYPVVMVNRRLKKKIGAYVVIDNKKGAYLITQHLIKNGYRKIVIITGPDGLSTVVERLEGYKQAMQEADLPLGKNAIHHVNFSRKEGFDAARGILAAKNRPEAIMGGNDYIAMGIMDAAKKLELSIPEDIAVVGFDNTGFAQSMEMTTVSQGKYEMGDIAVKMLIESIEGKKSRSVNRVILEPELILRNSSRRTKA
jgi:LacI family transcriptional regulator